MAITLRIVGIFYRTQVDLGANGGLVKDVLDAAVAQPTAGTTFSYATTTVDGTTSPSMFRAFYEADFTSHASKINYPGGEYILAEDLTSRPVYNVWQYYLFDKNNKFMNRDKGFVPFDQSPGAQVEDGWSVTWRLVSIYDPRPMTEKPARLKTALR